MLKALELSGFKSFAESTRLEFPPGITVIVGPNGSGKSNIVDAMKWVLGEQSAKSLRGREMADVIFKGSGSGAGDGGRRAAQAAEVTIVFENADRRLPVDAPEVHVTRRVYRSGEGEYLVNRQPCRLRDVRDLFRGTGVGTDAYSLIEQGKVDMLLQASPRDRRVIFEEAAGISRFKAKKIEAQRRLERVEQNLLRLSDIVEEVDNRLKAIRSQAAKARRYVQYTDRLQQLRTHVGRADWRRLSRKLDAIRTELDRLRAEANLLGTEAETLESRRLELETEASMAGEDLRTCEGQIAHHHEKITAGEAAMDHERRRMLELDEEIERCRRQLVALSTRTGGLEQQLRETREFLQQAEGTDREVRRRVAQHQEQVRLLDEQLVHLRAEIEQRRGHHLDRLQAQGQLNQTLTSAEAMTAEASATIDRCHATLSQLDVERDTGRQEQRDLEMLEQQIRLQVEDRLTAWQAQQEALRDSRRQMSKLLDQLSDDRGRRAADAERVSLLRELDARREGISIGVQEALDQAREHALSPYGSIRGMLADLLTVSVELAPLVDAALGDYAQHLVVDDRRLLDHLVETAPPFGGRVGFLLPADARDAPPVSDPNPFLDEPGVLGPADRLIDAPRDVQPTIARLLGHTWFVDDLSVAVRLCQGADLDPRTRFVTRQGECVGADGLMLLGPRQAAIGFVSRRSELRHLEQQLTEWDRRIDHHKTQVEQLQATIDQQEQGTSDLGREHQECSTRWTETRARLAACGVRLDSLQQRRDKVAIELVEAERRQTEARELQRRTQSSVEELAREVSQLALQLREHDQRLNQLDLDRRRVSSDATTAQVDLAKSEQRVEALRARLEQFHQTHRERRRAWEETRAQLGTAWDRRRQAEMVILKTSSLSAELYLLDESLRRQREHLVHFREELSKTRGELGQRWQAVRQHLAELQQQLHRHELEESEAAHERHALAQRLHEDYQIELSQLQDNGQEGVEQERQAIDEEIDQLRRKINNMGAVNLEALDELEQIELRYGALSEQHRDLVESKDALDRIIQRINADSRRLFRETLEAIRVNFRAMFRKVFGGGQADIVLEEGVDILETGIDIVATPPGKQSLGISLLSGGERALTAVTLLLAIFEYRPSPFCVLDEVDGPLDEANIGRFVDVLRGFLTSTKFIVVTHSKKTMTAANTLYGITMQESGVSKRVAVQFEDFSDDGGPPSGPGTTSSHPGPDAQNARDDERGAA